MAPMTFVEMLKISIAMPILLVLSFAVIAQALERLYAFWFSQRLPAGLWDRVKERLEAGDKPGALSLARRDSGIMGEALSRLIALDNPTNERLIENFQLHRQRLSMALNRRVGLFGTASFIAPLIGLMGTVLGIMRAFHDLSAAGAGGPAVVAAGISEALIATAFGIGVAVVASLLYNYFTLAARARLGTADLWVLELAVLLEGRPVSGGNPFHRDESAAPISEVNVVPLADVSLVLLIILLVLSPMAAQSMLKVQSAAAKAAPPKPPSAEDLVPQRPPEAVLAVGLSPAGYVVEGRFLGGDAELRAWLVPELARRDDKKVFLAPELETPHGRVVNAIETIQGLGAPAVALVQVFDPNAGAPTEPAATAPDEGR